MNIEKITVRVTSTGQTMEVVVYNKRPTGITVVLGPLEAEVAAWARRRIVFRDGCVVEDAAQEGVAA